MDIPVGVCVAVSIEFPELVANLDEDEREDEIEDKVKDEVEDEVEDESDDVWEALLVDFAEADVPVFFDADDVRVVNGTVLTLVTSLKWNWLRPEQHVVPVVVSQQYLPPDSDMHIAMLLYPTA